MGAVLQRFIETIRFDREAFVWMEFNDRATGDALILVVITQVLMLIAGGTPLLGFVSGFAVVGVIVNTVIFWLIYSAIVFAVAKYLFRGDGIYAYYLRLAGFAFPTLLLLILSDLFISANQIAALVGSLWFLAVVAYGTHYVADLPLSRAAIASIAGYGGWIIIQQIRQGLSIF